MFLFDFESKEKDKIIKTVSELILNGGNELKDALKKARPITEMP